jgi:hypothetical protein
LAAAIYMIDHPVSVLPVGHPDNGGKKRPDFFNVISPAII